MQQDLKNLGIKDIPKLIKDIQASKNPALTALEAIARANANAAAEENK
jgi:hypothetical protein